jgi:uncharacterized protein YndB with AHSA1/START domain
MTDRLGKTPSEEEIALEYELDAPPEKVWRAIAIAQFRDSWLPDRALAEAEPVSAIPGEEICYRMRDDLPPFLESTVTFRIGPGIHGGTLFRIVHRIDGERALAANDNKLRLMLAA